MLYGILEYNVYICVILTHMVQLVLAELHREVDHKRPSNGQIEQGEHSVQP